MQFTKHVFLHLFLLFILLFSLGACSKSAQTPTFPDVIIGIAPIIQVNNVKDLLAGNIPQPYVRATTEQVAQMQEVLDKKTHALIREVTPLPLLSDELTKQLQSSTRGALEYWTAYAKHHQVDLLIIPFLNHYNTSPSALMLDFCILDLRNQPRLIDRFLFAEQELLENSAENSSSFIKRKKNYAMKNLIEDAIDQAFKGFNLK